LLKVTDVPLTAVPESIHVVPHRSVDVEYVVCMNRGVPSLTDVQLGVNDPARVTNPLGGLYQMNEVGPVASTQLTKELAINPAITKKTFEGLVLVKSALILLQGLTGLLYKIS